LLQPRARKKKALLGQNYMGEQAGSGAEKKDQKSWHPKTPNTKQKTQRWGKSLQSSKT